MTKGAACGRVDPLRSTRRGTCFCGRNLTVPPPGRFIFLLPSPSRRPALATVSRATPLFSTMRRPSACRKSPADAGRFLQAEQKWENHSIPPLLAACGRVDPLRSTRRGTCFCGRNLTVPLQEDLSSCCPPLHAGPESPPCRHAHKPAASSSSKVSFSQLSSLNTVMPFSRSRDAATPSPGMRRPEKVPS